ncbi:MAG: leucyl aminopeptidase [Thermoplasmata archaeon]
MEIKVVQGEIQKVEDEGIVVNLFEGVRKPGGATGAVDKALGGRISSLIRSGDFKGKFKESYLLRADGNIPSPRVLIAGLGKSEDLTLDRVREVAGECAKSFRDRGCHSFSTIVHGAGIGGIPSTQAAEAVAEGSWLASYEFTRYRTEKKEEIKELKKVTIVERDKRKVKSYRKVVSDAKIISSAVAEVRDLVNMPGNDKPPSYLANYARKIADETGVRLKVLNEKEARKLEMGAFLGVAQGSERPAKFIILEYEGRKERPIVLVGKGITFDTGGISLKPLKGLWPMWKMKEDMSGAATVMLAVKAAAQLRLPLHLVAIAPCAENMPSGSAIRPGDVLRTMSGKTIEVISTDAEGRLILADALSYAMRYKPQAILDMATLTGACAIGLGRKTSGIMGNDKELIERLIKAGESVGERIWELPMFDEYEEQIKSEVADMKNSGGSFGGAITAAWLLRKFVGDTPWVHLDVAGTAFSDGSADSYKRSYIPKGATGVGLRTIVQLLRNWRRKR